MVEQYRQHLEQILSSDRLSAYAPSNNDALETITNYFWNIALCQALYPCLGNLEIAVRNRIHATLAGHFQQPNWYDRPRLLQTYELRSVAEAKKKVVASGRTVTPGRVIAALNFGFWTSMLGTLYGNSPKGPRLWAAPNSPLLIAAFPHAPGHARGVRRPIFNRLDDIRLLRNRVFHYERIYHGIELPARSRQRGAQRKHLSLERMHMDIIDLIGWIDPLLQATVVYLDSFTDTYENGYGVIAARLKTHTEFEEVKV